MCSTLAIIAEESLIRRTWPAAAVAVAATGDRWVNCTMLTLLTTVVVSFWVFPCFGPSPRISCARLARLASPGPSSAPRSHASSWLDGSGTTWWPAHLSDPGWMRFRPCRPAIGTSGTGTASPTRIFGGWWTRYVTYASFWAATVSWTDSNDWNWYLWKERKMLFLIKRITDIYV